MSIYRTMPEPCRRCAEYEAEKRELPMPSWKRTVITVWVLYPVLLVILTGSYFVGGFGSDGRTALTVTGIVAGIFAVVISAIEILDQPK